MNDVASNDARLYAARLLNAHCRLFVDRIRICVEKVDAADRVAECSQAEAREEVANLQSGRLLAAFNVCKSTLTSSATININ